MFGHDIDGWTEARGRRELQVILAQLSAGIPIEQGLARYEPEPVPEEGEYAPGVTMHEYASHWLERRRVGRSERDRLPRAPIRTTSGGSGSTSSPSSAAWR